VAAADTADGARLEAELERLLPAADSAPARLREAMRHALLGGGKRLRPRLVLLACRACGGEDDDALPVAVAFEMIHAYSLVHDDLPAMDDDALRRGQPTVHVAFDEATAILAGDALLTRAFEIIATQPPALAADRRARLLAIAAAAAGAGGMIGGQILDLAAEGQALPLEPLTALHGMKTGALIAAAAVAGGVVAGATPAALESLDRYGRALGLAFQIVDDILDETGTSAHLGKSAGKDRRAGKSTFPALLGLEASRRAARLQAEAAHAALAPLGPAADPLRRLADFVVARDR